MGCHGRIREHEFIYPRNVCCPYMDQYTNVVCCNRRVPHANCLPSHDNHMQLPTYWPAAPTVCMRRVPFISFFQAQHTFARGAPHNHVVFGNHPVEVFTSKREISRRETPPVTRHRARNAPSYQATRGRHPVSRGCWFRFRLSREWGGVANTPQLPGGAQQTPGKWGWLAPLRRWFARDKDTVIR